MFLHSASVLQRKILSTPHASRSSVPLAELRPSDSEMCPKHSQTSLAMSIGHQKKPRCACSLFGLWSQWAAVLDGIETIISYRVFSPCRSAILECLHLHMIKNRQSHELSLNRGLLSVHLHLPASHPTHWGNPPIEQGFNVLRWVSAHMFFPEKAVQCTWRLVTIATTVKCMYNYVQYINIYPSCGYHLVK